MKTIEIKRWDNYQVIKAIQKRSKRLIAKH